MTPAEQKHNFALQRQQNDADMAINHHFLKGAVDAAKRLPEFFGRIEKLEAVTGRKPAPITLNAKLAPPDEPKGTVQPPDQGTATYAAINAKVRSFGTNLGSGQELRRLLPGDENRLNRKAAENILTRSTTDTATTTGIGWGTDLTSGKQFSFYKANSERSIVSYLLKNDIITALDFGPNGWVTVPSRNDAHKGELAASFVGENATIPVKSTLLGATTINRYKMAVISTFTNELLKVTTPAIDKFIRDTIAEDTAVGLDGHFLSDNAAVLGVAPAGILADAESTASTGLVDDITWLISKLTATKARKPIILVTPDKMLELLLLRENGQFIFRRELERTSKILGYQIIANANCPADKMIALDGDKILMALSDPEIDTATSATLVMADDDGTDPSMAETGAVTIEGSIKVSDAADTTPATQVHSVYQHNATAIRLVLPLSWGAIYGDAAFYVAL